MNAASSQPQSLSFVASPLDSWIDGLAGTCLGGWVTACMVLQVPEATALSVVATGGLLLARVARLWGVALSMAGLAYVLAQQPTWIREDLLLRGGLILGLVNIWMMIGLRTRASSPAVAPAFDAPLQDVERSLMPHSAQVKRDFDRAVAELAQERDRLRALELEASSLRDQLLKSQEAASCASGRCSELEQQQASLQQELLMVRQEQQSLQEELTPVRLEASELRAVLERTMARSQDLEEQGRLLDELKETLRTAQDEVAAKQQTLEQQGGQLQLALDRLLQEQEAKALLETLVEGKREAQAKAEESLEGVRQDLERQEKVADSLLQKIVELEATVRTLQEAESLARLQATTTGALAEQAIAAWIVLATRRQRDVETQQSTIEALRGELQQAQTLLEERLQAGQQVYEVGLELQQVQAARAEQSEQLEQLRAQLEQQQAAFSALQSERAEILGAYEHLQQELVNDRQSAALHQQHLQASLEALQAQAMHVAQSQHARLEQSVLAAQRELEEWRAKATQMGEQRGALEEAIASARQQAAHAQALVSLREEELQKLREQLQDPQRLESQKKASMLERQLAVKEQVIARLQTQQTELPDLVRIKHQHLQLREQFEAHRQAAEQLAAQNTELQQQILVYQEMTEGPEPSAAETQLLALLAETEQDRALLEEELHLSAAALRQLL